MSSKTPTRESSSGAARYYAVVLAALAGATIVLQIASMGPLRDSFWGFHLYAFLPFPIAVLSWLLVVLAGVALWRAVGKPGPAVAWLDVVDRYPTVFALAFAVVCASVFWLLRSQQLLLGDAHPLVVDLPQGQYFHPRQPGMMWLQQFLYQHLGSWFRAEGLTEHDVAGNVVALGSVVAGFVFVLVVVALGRSLARETDHGRPVPWLVTLILLSQGYALLFFGYIENYTFYALFVATYLLTAVLHLQGRLTLQVVVLVYLTGLALHLSTMALLPSLLFLLARGLYRRSTRIDTAIAVGVFVAGLFLVDWLLRTMSAGFGLWKGLSDIIKIARESQGGGTGVSYWFSPVHLRDFVNEHFLIGPLGAFLLVPALFYAGRMVGHRRRSFGALDVFLSLASLSYLAGSFAMSEPLLGYARDWDLFAPAGVCYTTVGVYFLIQHVRNGAAVSRLLAFALVFSLLQLTPWVRINHSEALSLERFKTLPLGYGRTEVVVANYYFRKNQYEESARWLQKAVQVNPGNANAYRLLANIFIDREEFDRAREAYVRALTLRPDKIEFRNDYASLLYRMQRYEEVLPELRWLVERAPDNVVYWRSLREVLLTMKRYDELVPVNERLLELYDGQLAQSPNDISLHIDTGILLGDLERFDEALDRFAAALQIDPNSAAALFNTASAMGRAGRGREAKPYLERFLQLYPDHSMAVWAREQLDKMAE
jgi:tetratricopeptide (TPR) repeat protein